MEQDQGTVGVPIHRTLHRHLSVQEHALPLESERMRKTTGRDSRVSQILIVQGSLQPNRFKMIIVKENLGF